METNLPQSQNGKCVQRLSQIMIWFEEYYQDRLKKQVWSSIFYSISMYMSKEGPISPDSQKLVNFFLQHKSQTSPLGQLVSQNKELICKIYDLAMNGSESIDAALSSGMLREVACKKLLNGQNENSGAAKVLTFSVSAVALHFCQFLNRFKQANGCSTILTNRRLPKIINRKSHVFYSNSQFMDDLFAEPVTLMQGFLDNIKQILGNYLNMQTLFQVTSKNFKDKKALLTGYIQTKNSTKPQLIGKTVNLSAIFDSSFTGREMIQKKLANINLLDQQQSNFNHKWSLLTCITQFQFNLQCIFEKLPIFLKPLSNGDILSYLRKKITPIFKYQIIKSGYIEGPFLSEFVEVLVNVGKHPIQVLSFGYSSQAQELLAKNENENIWEIIEKLNVKYSKIKVSSKSIAIIPNNNYYLLAGTLSLNNTGSLSQIIRWSILPKNMVIISNSIKAMETKRRGFKNLFFLPMQLIFLDFLSHQFMKLQNLQIVKTLIAYLDTQILKQQKILCQIIKINPLIHLTINPITYCQRFCFNCFMPIINFYCSTESHKILCLSCRIDFINYARKDQIFLIYHPYDLRDSLLTSKIYIHKRKVPGEKIQNKYQNLICNKDFIGAYDSQNCRGQSMQEPYHPGNYPINLDKIQELYFNNKYKQMKIMTTQQILISLAVSKVPTTEADRQMLMTKINMIAKQIRDPEELKKAICTKYDMNNNVLTVLNAMTFRAAV